MIYGCSHASHGSSQRSVYVCLHEAALPNDNTAERTVSMITAPSDWRLSGPTLL